MFDIVYQVAYNCNMSARKQKTAGAEKPSAVDTTVEVQKVIKYDLLRVSKKYLLYIGFALTGLAITYCIVGFFSEWFTSRFWWLALLAIPFVVLSFLCIRITKLKSASKRYQVFAWLALSVNIVAIAIITVTAIPEINSKFHELYIN